MEEGKSTHEVQDTSAKPSELTNNLPCLDVDKTDDKIVAGQSEQAAVSLQSYRYDGCLKGQSMLQLRCVKIKELSEQCVSEFLAKRVGDNVR